MGMAAACAVGGTAAVGAAGGAGLLGAVGAAASIALPVLGIVAGGVALTGAALLAGKVIGGLLKPKPEKPEKPEKPQTGCEKPQKPCTKPPKPCTKPPKPPQCPYEVQHSCSHAHYQHGMETQGNSCKSKLAYFYHKRKLEIQYMQYITYMQYRHQVQLDFMRAASQYHFHVPPVFAHHGKW
ncbi:hypothetical protein [Veronia pacifica]|uniref:Uncharacterized protein n=1 Tax=Veronia pacifica TaxID=1080227 RepID=A0A1C3EPI6_9GAMM|nr:hypothetical protein [Veronia pacifica]ODA35133.1 hypothetical protein A8L45_05525 [Veronia pacifica]